MKICFHLLPPRVQTSKRFNLSRCEMNYICLHLFIRFASLALCSRTNFVFIFSAFAYARIIRKCSPAMASLKSLMPILIISSSSLMASKAENSESLQGELPLTCVAGGGFRRYRARVRLHSIYYSICRRLRELILVNLACKSFEEFVVLIHRTSLPLKASGLMLDRSSQFGSSIFLLVRLLLLLKRDEIERQKNRLNSSSNHLLTVMCGWKAMMMEQKRRRKCETTEHQCNLCASDYIQLRWRNSSNLDSHHFVISRNNIQLRSLSHQAASSNIPGPRARSML